jgi:hypothetical protein
LRRRLTAGVRLSLQEDSSIMKTTVGMLSVLLATVFLSAYSHGNALVEVVLSARLDEPRGYCLDVIGHQANATPARGLQAHSCYSYQGRLGVDQAFDADRMPAGEFQLPWFKVCMSRSALHAGASLRLTACDGSAEQYFTFTSQGQIVPQGAPDLCLTVADGPAMPGGGGHPVHLWRRLTLEPCTASRIAHQTWRVRTQAD